MTNSAKARTSVNTIEVASIPSTILISFGISPPPRLQTVKSEYHVQIPITVVKHLKVPLNLKNDLSIKTLRLWELGESGLDDEDTKHPKIARLLQFLISAITKSVPLIPFKYAHIRVTNSIITNLQCLHHCDSILD